MFLLQNFSDYALLKLPYLIEKIPFFSYHLSEFLVDSSFLHFKVAIKSVTLGCEIPW